MERDFSVEGQDSYTFVLYPSPENKNSRDRYTIVQRLISTAGTLQNCINQTNDH